MWNSAQRGTLELANAFMAALPTYMPRDFECRLNLPEPGGPGMADATLKARIGGEGVTFLIQVQANGSSPTGRLEAAARQDGTIPLVLSRYLSPAARSTLVRAQCSYWDTTGNAHISSERPFILINTHGAQRDPEPSQAEAPRALKSLAGAAAARVILQLLTDPSPITVRDLATRSGTGVGTVSRVVSLLRRENLLAATGSNAVLPESRLDLIERWVQDYDFVATNKSTRYRSPLGLEGVKAAVERSLEPGMFAYTGLEAAKRWLNLYAPGRPMSLPVTDLWLYALDPLAVEDKAKLIADRRGDIIVARGGFLAADVHNEDSNQSPDLHSAYPWRVAGDLMSQSGRHAQMGKELAEMIEAKKGLL